MDPKEINDRLIQLLEIADMVDDMGVGSLNATNGQIATRKVCELELIQFLMYIANCSADFSQVEVSVLNFISETEGTASHWKSFAMSTESPMDSRCFSLLIFMAADEKLAEFSGKQSADLTRYLIHEFGYFGGIMALLNGSAAAAERCCQYIQKLQEFADKYTIGG